MTAVCRSVERCGFESHPEAIDQGKAVSFFHPSYLIPNLIETISTLRDTKELDVNSNSCGSSTMWSLAASCFPYFPRQPQYSIISTELEIFGYQIERQLGGRWEACRAAATYGRKYDTPQENVLPGKQMLIITQRQDKQLSFCSH